MSLSKFSKEEIKKRLKESNQYIEKQTKIIQKLEK
jgi:hypothetical protein